MVFPASEVATEQVTEQPTGQVSKEVQKVVSTLEVEMKLKELMDALELRHRKIIENRHQEQIYKR